MTRANLIARAMPYEDGPCKRHARDRRSEVGTGQTGCANRTEYSP